MAGEAQPQRRARVVPASSAATVAVVAAGAAVGFAAGHYTAHTTTVTTTVAAAAAATATQPTSASVSPQVAAGAHTFVQFACSQCHGEQGRGGVSPYVPALKQLGNQLTVAQLTQIIDHGLGESANPKKPYMPVWGAVISKTQVSDLVAYIRAGLPAVSDTQPVAVPQGQGPAVAGAALYVRYGCVNCHGPNGLGGVPNPLSPDKSIPPLAGQGFRHDFPTDKAISRRHPQRQRDRQGADREHAALGRDPLVDAGRRPRRVPEDPEVAPAPSPSRTARDGS